MDHELPLEHLAPNYTVLERVQEGMKVITRVIMDGEIIEFEKPYDKLSLNENK